MILFALEEGGLAGGLSYGLEAHPANRTILTVFIDMVEEAARGADRHISTLSAV
jgi:hypothetical protein